MTLCVNGQVKRKHTRASWSKRGLQRGDQLLLSRPLGTGVLFSAAMQGLPMQTIWTEPSA